ncbi:unnamed protein product [Oppiella nova]|uniref:Uncharacterized protein n=1 Tax=Oppiella nova TaxID=334625 RepID=A0A7R9LXQ7_9ACAR|nr:unnamed protein product [Oppiella nova]CAG2167905.1 unnamed protein product [Oppiella nova]
MVCALSPVFKEIIDYQGFKQLELNRISEVISASNVFIYPLSTNIYTIKDKIDYIRVAAQMAEKRIQDVITYISDLCPNDQYYLLKYGCSEILSQRKWPKNASRTLSHIYQYYLLKYGCSEILSLRRVTYYNDKTKFLEKICPEWDWDLTILNLLTTIILFNPNRPNLIHRDTCVVTKESRTT